MRIPRGRPQGQNFARFQIRGKPRRRRDENRQKRGFLFFEPRKKLKKQKYNKGAGERKLGCKPDSVVPEGTGIHLSAP